jgi:hypothetical protein
LLAAKFVVAVVLPEENYFTGVHSHALSIRSLLTRYLVNERPRRNGLRSSLLAKFSFYLLAFDSSRSCRTALWLTERMGTGQYAVKVTASRDGRNTIKRDSLTSVDFVKGLTFISTFISEL